ncbi:neuronal acetylcholine receptor subunit alpha-7 [Patella vulgata]|uniref:neuronal acetylcholine receptor subunit alpha-7 n=1 Tax=Patella vulgata TaxID=6465 RepID=UPI0024A7E5DA|nr:neuronal acetylcholine receptor subunit alpha-7 [Patella vulgata]
MTTSSVRLVLVVVLILLSTSIYSSEAATAEDVARLFQEKVMNGSSKIRPVMNQSDIVDVEMTLHIVSLLDVNEVQQSVEATIWMQVFWKNELLVWNPNDYGNLTSVYPPETNMWKPDLAISNGYDELTPVGLDFVLLQSRHDGETEWNPGQKVSFLCKIDVSKFPFDMQTCSMVFFNWAGKRDETSLNYRESTEMKEAEAGYANSEWAIIERRTEKQQNSPHETVRVILVLQRKSLSLVLTVLLPVILLAFLNVFVFLLPTESGEKLSFSVTVLLSQAVFLSFISGLMPQTSDSISGLSIYISAQLVLSAIYVLVTCFNLSMYHRDSRNRPIPRWLTKILCVRVDSDNNVYPIKENDEKLVTMADSLTGSDICLRLDRICFWVFLIVVFLMTALFLGDGLSAQIKT